MNDEQGIQISKPKGFRLYILVAWIAFLFLACGVLAFLSIFIGTSIFGILTATAALAFFPIGVLFGVFALVLYYSASKSQSSAKKSTLFLPLAIFLVFFSIIIALAVISLAGIKI
jgi:hypothetical protein